MLSRGRCQRFALAFDWPTVPPCRLVQSYRAPASLWGRRRRLLGVVAILEALYLVQAPACVYLPYVPAKSSVERVVLGADAAGQLYWLEGRSPMAFAWGPRWW